MSNHTVTVPTGSPPSWVNIMATGMLRTPVLQRVVGRSVALITVIGRRTAKPYTFPVSYYRDGDTVVVITKRFRTRWRNLESIPEVGLRLAGRPHLGLARVVRNGPEALSLLIKFSSHRHRDANAFGITFTPSGYVNESRARAVLPDLVILEITLAG